MPKYNNRKCQFCNRNIQDVDFKDLGLLMRYISKYWKIVPSYYSGNCVRHQKMVARAVKNARRMALIPYTKPLEGF